jgi:uncharacterized protein YjbJ (UPF0337 family)
VLGNIILRLVMAIGSRLNHYQERLMNKDQIKGRAEETKGKVKEAAGVILDDEALQAEGNIQKNVGKARASFGDLKNDIKKST